jgi:tetratricopeptide (TPR) repeat protein
MGTQLFLMAYNHILQCLCGRFIAFRFLVTSILTIILTLSLFLNYSVAQKAEENYSDTHNLSTNHIVYRLAIPPFKSDNIGHKYDFLERSFPEVVAIGLISNDLIQYVDHKYFWDAAMKVYPVDIIRNEKDKIFEERILDQLNIDLILRGNFIEYRDQIRFEAILEYRKEKKSVNISSKVVKTKQIYSGIDQFIKELNAEIKRLQIPKEAINLAIMCFDETTQHPSDANKFREKDIAVHLISTIETEKEIAVVPWHKSKKFCGFRGGTNREIAQLIKADAMLKGTFSIFKDKIKITPTLFIKETDSLIALNSLEQPLSDYNKILEYLTDDIENIMDAIIGVEKRWNTDILQFGSDDPFYYLDNGKFYMNEGGNLYIAALMFAECIKRSPRNDEAHYLLGIVRGKQGRHQEALDEFEKSIEINPNHNFALSGMADEYIDMGNFGMALEALKKLFNINSNFENIHYKLGEAYYLLNELDHSIRELILASEMNPKDPEIYNLIGTVYRSMGDTEMATSAYQSVLDIDPENSTAKFNLSTIYYNKGERFSRERNFEKASEMFLKSIVYDPDSSDANRALGYSLKNHEQYIKAIEYFEKAIELSPDDSDAYVGLGGALYNLGKYEKAIENYQRAVDLNPADIGAKADIAEACLTAELFDKATVLAKEVLNEKSSYSIILAMRVVIMSSLLLQGKTSETYNELIKYIEFYNSLNRYNEYGWRYHRLKIFLNELNKLGETEKALLLDIININEHPKHEGKKKIKDIEKYFSFLTMKN